MIKKIIFLFIFSLSELAFSQANFDTFQVRQQEKDLKIADAITAEQFDKELENFISVLERNFVFREQTLELIKKFPNAQRSGDTYQKWVIHSLYSAAEYLETRKFFLNISSKYSVYKDLWGNPNVSFLTKKKMILAVSAALQIYDNYFELVNLVLQNNDLRILLNKGDQTNNIPEGILDLISAQAKQWKLRDLLAKQVEGYDKFLKKLPPSAVDNQIYYLVGTISASPSYKVFRNGLIDRLFQFAEIRGSDKFHKINDMLFTYAPSSVTDFLSWGFGNTVGMVEQRKGKLHPIHKPLLSRMITPQMKPLDVLLEKTPFRLTDRFIPGHWGHVAIWIGSKEQLQSEGLWDLITNENTQPAWRNMSPKKRERIVEALSKGEVILEALRPGVQLNSLEHFLNIDDFLVLRPDYIQNNPQRKAELIAQALTHFEKDYDFNFDVKTADKIVCSELAYWVFSDIKWHTEHKLGRDSISPDNIIKTVLGGNQFSAVILYHDGKKVRDSGQNFRNELCSLQKDSTLKHINEGCP